MQNFASLASMVVQLAYCMKLDWLRQQEWSVLCNRST